MAFPSSYYKNALEGASEMEWAEKKAERKAYRAKVGCKGCMYKQQGPWDTLVCGIGQTPHSGGWCKKWWSDQSERGPDEA